jgi:hypothetical protein
MEVRGGVAVQKIDDLATSVSLHNLFDHLYILKTFIVLSLLSSHQKFSKSTVSFIRAPYAGCPSISRK